MFCWQEGRSVTNIDKYQYKSCIKKVVVVHNFKPALADVELSFST